MRIRINAHPQFWVGDLKGFAEQMAREYLASLGVECEFTHSRKDCHFNVMLGEGESDNANTRGVEIFYNTDKSINERLAKHLINGICSNTAFMNRGIRGEKMVWDLYVVCGYSTNAFDKIALEDRNTKRKIVWGIVEGLKECLQWLPHSKRQNFEPA